ncbi:MAG TPA: hypothetical protein VL172_10190, partial [Kofleriaceae bacterium]|nr:hypothetical protein [Kofleriaceae bacterium]
MIRFIVMAIAIAARAVSAHAGPCMIRGWEAYVVTPADRDIPADGGVLVGMREGDRDDPGGLGTIGGDDPAKKDLELKRGKSTLALGAERLAPGLVRYTPARATSGVWKVAGDGLEADVRFGAAPLAAMPAPALTDVVFTSGTQSYGGRGGSGPYFQTTATLGAPRPDDAIGIIIYAQPRSGPERAVEFRQVPAGATSVVLDSTPGRCHTSPPGGGPAIGLAVTAAWVDVFGRQSPHSAAVVSRNAAAPAGAVDAGVPPAPADAAAPVKAPPVGPVSAPPSPPTPGKKSKSGCAA